jgi:hypothetical protein
VRWLILGADEADVVVRSQTCCRYIIQVGGGLVLYWVHQRSSLFACSNADVPSQSNAALAHS